MERAVRRAIAYNRNKLTKNETRFIQRKLGIESDGIWGPDSVHAVMCFQERQRLNPDGKVGPVTLDQIRLYDTKKPKPMVLDIDLEQYMFMMNPTFIKESGGLKNPYKATNEDWERRGAFDTPRRHPDTREKLSPAQRKAWRTNNPERAKADGYKAFWASQYQDDGSPGTHISLSFGAIQFACLPGSLGKLLKHAYEKSPEGFKRDFGPHWEELLDITNRGKGDVKVRDGLGPNKRGDNTMPVGGHDLWQSYWVEKFEASANSSYMVESQVELAIERYFKPAIEICQDHGWCDQVSLAVVFDMCVQFGPGRVRMLKNGKVDRKWSKGTKEYLAVAEQKYGKGTIMSYLRVLSDHHRKRREWVASKMNRLIEYRLD